MVNFDLSLLVFTNSDDAGHVLLCRRIRTRQERKVIERIIVRSTVGIYGTGIAIDLLHHKAGSMPAKSSPHPSVVRLSDSNPTSSC